MSAAHRADEWNKLSVSVHDELGAVLEIDQAAMKEMSIDT